MKAIITTYLLFALASTAVADIPREDIIAFTYEGETYYTPAFTGGYTFTGDSVLHYDGTCLGKFAELLSICYGDNSLVAFPDMVRIPRVKVGQKYCEENAGYYNRDILVLTGERIMLDADQVQLLAADSLIIGYAAGEINSATLSKADEGWIQDYPLERIAKLNDGELCDIELFAIAGNVSAVEAYNIKADLLDYYNTN